MKFLRRVDIKHPHTEIGLVLLLGVLTWLSRLPFQPQWLNSVDAINYVLAVEHFDVRLHQTQPPGYYLYILGVRAVNMVVQDPTRALFHFSGLTSGLAVVGIYLVGREISGQRAGIISALLLSTSTIFWHQSEIAAPYAGDIALSAFVGWSTYRAQKTKKTRDLLLSALLLGISGAYRPQTLFFLAPLLLCALWGRPWKLWLISGFVVAISAGGLFSPAIAASGGLSGYLEAVLNLQQGIVTTHQVQYGGRRYLRYIITTLKYTILTVGELGMILVLIGFTRHISKRKLHTLTFLALWVAPTWLVFCLLYPGNIGTILVCMPPFFLLAASSFNSPTSLRKQRVQALILSSILAWQIILFVWLPKEALGEGYRAFHNASAIQWVDHYVRDHLALIDEYPDEDTIIIAYKNYRLLHHYRPSYTTYSQPNYATGQPETVTSVVRLVGGQTTKLEDMSAQDLIPQGTRTILLLEVPPEHLQASAPWLVQHARNDVNIYAITIPMNQQAVWTPDGFVLVPRKVTQQDLPSCEVSYG